MTKVEFQHYDLTLLPFGGEDYGDIALPPQGHPFRLIQSSRD